MSRGLGTISLRKIEILLPESGGVGKMNDKQVKIKGALYNTINVFIDTTNKNYC